MWSWSIGGTADDQCNGISTIHQVYSVSNTESLVTIVGGFLSDKLIFSHSSRYYATRELSNPNYPAMAIFAASFNIGTGALRWCQQLGSYSASNAFGIVDTAMVVDTRTAAYHTQLVYTIVGYVTSASITFGSGDNELIN